MRYPLPTCDDLFAAPADPAAGPLVCRCLQVYERDLATAVAAFDLQTLQEVRRLTGAGDGCTCCHDRIRACLARYTQSLASSSSALPICSVR